MANKLLNLNKAKREGPKDANGSTHLTHLIGYKGSKVADALTSHPLLRIHSIAPPSKIIASNPVVFLFKAAFRVITQLIVLISLLFFELPQLDVLIVQNPPAIPTLIIAQLLRLLRGTKLIIDWHNFGFSIMALGKGESNKIVKLAKWYEITFGRYADAHLCVTKAMAHHLKTVFHVKGPVIVLYDRAPSHFHRLTLPDSHEFLSQMAITPTNTFDYRTPTSTSPPYPQQTLLTTKLTPTSNPTLTSNRPALIVSSTSWTPDEDFSILLDALVHYDTHATPRHKNLVIVVTGKGPLKAHYLSKIPSLNLSPRVKVLTAWLAVEDYPKLLGAADLGVCLHTSSSGLDLPMKVVDMFGCGLPVAAVTYPCLAEEMVVDGVNGVLVRDGVGLGGVLLRLFDGKSGEEEVEKLRKGTEPFQRERWDENWERCVGGLVI